MRRPVALAVALTLAGAPAATADVEPVVPQENAYYDITQLFSGPCEPAQALPAPKRGDDRAEATFVQSYFVSKIMDERWGTIAPTTKPDEEGVYPQPENPRGTCKGDQRGEVDGFVDIVSPIGVNKMELGSNSMVTERITSNYGVCGAGTSGGDISPQANWCNDGAYEGSSQILDIVTFQLYWHCSYTILSATRGAKVQGKSGKVRPAGHIAMAGETIIVPRGGRVVIESGPTKLTLLTGRYPLDDPKSCELRLLGFKYPKTAPPPVSPRLHDGVIRATLKALGFRVQTPEASVGPAPAARPRGGPAPVQETGVRIEREAATRTTEVCAAEGRVLVRTPKRSLTVEPGRCVTVTSARP